MRRETKEEMTRSKLKISRRRRQLTIHTIEPKLKEHKLAVVKNPKHEFSERNTEFGRAAQLELIMQLISMNRRESHDKL